MKKAFMVYSKDKSISKKIIVSEQDFEKIKKHKWYIHCPSENSYIIQTTCKLPNETTSQSTSIGQVIAGTRSRRILRKNTHIDDWSRNNLKYGGLTKQGKNKKIKLELEHKKTMNEILKTKLNDAKEIIISRNGDIKAKF